MVSGFFPTPYPDECYYSILCRYFVRGGSTNNSHTIKKLFGNAQCLSTSLFFPMRLDCIEQWIPQGTAITRKSFAMKHSKYPYMAMIYSKKFRKDMAHVLNGKRANLNVDHYGRHKSWRLWPKYLRYCPLCTCEDMRLYGEPYWHRTHQLPGMMYCTKHHIRLMDSNIPVRDTTMTFYAASEQILSTQDDSSTSDIYSPYKELFLKIGQESEWLLQHGMDINWEFDFLTKYKRLLREKDVATVQGVADYCLIARKFNDYWGEDFLELLYSSMGDTRDWIHQLQEARITTFKPIYHILLMCFLKNTVKAFIECNTSENLFGEGPWPCQNPICKHYETDGCQNTRIQHMNGVATGFFQCDECGMIYKRTKRKGQTGNIMIVDYGNFWRAEFLRLLGTEKRTIPEAATILKRPAHLVGWQKKKMGLTKNTAYGKRVCRYGPDVNAETYYKEQVLKLCEEYDEVTLAILNQYAPGAYSYFSKHDFSWLRERMVYERDRVAHREYDRKLLKKIQKAVEQIQKGGDDERRITVGYIAKIAGVNETEVRYRLQKRSKTNAFLSRAVETKEAWLRRRITAIWQNKHDNFISLADVKREMSLKPNTFIKYKNFLKELMNELNDKTE
jgi:hypothetical protein